MDVAILAGGRGTRLSELTGDLPKPMVEVGGRPVLWHIMRNFQAAGFEKFVIALGYRGELIRRFFIDSQLAAGHLSIDGRRGVIATTRPASEPWQVQLIETGEETQTGGRIKRLEPWLGRRTFLLTWGDGLADVDLQQLVRFHRSHGRLATVTAVHPPSRFGRLELAGDVVARFEEKPRDETWINGAFFVLEPAVFDYIEGDDTSWERGPLRRLAEDGQLQAFRHEGFWQCMDTLHDRDLLQAYWESGTAPWKTWGDQSGRNDDACNGHRQRGLHRVSPDRSAA